MRCSAVLFNGWRRDNIPFAARHHHVPNGEECGEIHVRLSTAILTFSNVYSPITMFLPVHPRVEASRRQLAPLNDPVLKKQEPTF